MSTVETGLAADPAVPEAGVVDHAAHSPHSDPGRHAALLDDVPTDLEGLSRVARNVIAHYRAAEVDLPEEGRDDMHLRWVEAILGRDRERHDAPLSVPRAEVSRVQGCCRDHTLFCVAALRHHGVPARSRIGFAGYFTQGWHHDHVVPEAWLGGRWMRFDPEPTEGTAALPDPRNMAVGEGAPFLTAATAWRGYRRGELDADRFGVDPSVPHRGPEFIRDYVLREVAHRFGDELLLWDVWGLIGSPLQTDVALVDEVAQLLVAADGGSRDAEVELLGRYREDERLRPGRWIQRFSPVDDRARVDLVTRTETVTSV
jgi:hypothetical protein